MQQHSPNSKTETENLHQERVTTQKLLLTNVSSRGLINSLPCRSDGDFDENMQINYRRTNAEKRPATSLRLRERRTIDRRAMKTLTKRETLRRDTNACRIQSPQCADRRNVNQTLIDNRSLNIGERHQSSIFKLHSRSGKILPSSQQQGDSETFMNGLPTRDSGVLFVIFKNNVNQPQVCSPQLNNLKSLRKDTYSANDVVLSKLLTLKSEVFHERPSNRSSLIKNLLLLDTSICSIERRNQWKGRSPLVTLRRFLKFWKISTISAAAIDNRAPLVPNNVQKGTGCGWERINTIIPKEEMVKWILKKVLQQQQTASKRSSCKKPNGVDTNRNCIKTKLRTTKKRAMGALGLDRVVIRGDPKRFIQNRRRPTDFIVNQPQPKATMMTNSRECPEIDVVVIIICTVAGGGCQQQKQYQRSRHKKYRAKTTTSEFTISSSSSSLLLLSSLLSAGICLQPRTCWRGLLQRKGTLKHVKSTNSCVYVQLTHPWRPQRFGFYHLVQPQAVFIKPLLKLSQTLLLLLILLILLILLSSPLLVPLSLAATASLRDKVLTLKFKIKNDYPCKRKRRCIMFNSRIGDGGSGKGCASDSESGGDICCSCESRNFFVVVKTPKIMKKEAARLSGENMPRQFGPLVYNVIICPCICRIVLVQRSDLKKNCKNDTDNYNYNYYYHTNDTECYHYFISDTGCEIPDRRTILTKRPNTTLKIKSNSTLVKHGTEKKEQKFVNNNNHNNNNNNNNNNTQYKNKRNTCHSLGNRNTILNNTTTCFLAPFARCNIMCSGLLLRDDRPAKNRRQKNDSFSYAKNDSLFSGRCDSSFKSKPPFTHPNEQFPPKSSVRLTHTRGCRTLTGRKNHRASGQNDWTSIFIILRIGGLRIRFKYKKAIIAYTNKTTTTTTTTNHSIHDKNETNKNTENVYCCYRSPSVLLLFFFFFLRKKKKAKEVEVDDDGKLYGPVPFVINSQKDKVRLLEGYCRSNSSPGLAVGQRIKRKKTVTAVLALSDENLSCNGSDVHVRIRTNSVVDAIYNYCYYYNSYYFDEIRKPVFRDKIRYLNLLRAADRKLEERGERVGCVAFASNDGWIQQRKDVSILTVRKAVTGAALKEEEEENGEFNFGKTSWPWLTSIANRSVTSRELREKKGIANKHEEKKEMKRCSSSYNCIRGRAGACAVKGGEGRMKERSNSIGGGRGEEKGNSLRRRRISRSRKGGSRVGGVRLAPLFLAVPGSSDYYEATVDARHGSFEHAGNLFTATATSSEWTRRLLARTMDTTSPGIPTTATHSQQKHRLVFDRIRHCDSYKPTAMNPINNKHTVSHNPTTSDTNNNNNTATNIKTKNKITHTNKKSLAISNDDFKLNLSFNTTKSTPIRFGEHAYYNNTYNNSNNNININNGLIVSETRHSRKGVPSEPRGQTHEEGLSSAYSTPSPSASLASQPSSSSCSYVGRSGRHHNPGSWPLPTATSPQQHPHQRQQQQQQQQQQHRHNHNHNPLQKQPQQKHGLSQNNSNNNNNKNITNNNINNTNNSNKNKNNNNTNNNNGNKMYVSSFCYDFCDSIKDFGPRFSGLKTLVSRFLPNWGKTFLSLLLVFHVVGTSLLAGAVPLPRRKNTNEVKGLDYLMNFGYVSGPSQEAENLMSEDVKVESIKRFQTFANLPVTGIFDHRTMEMMEKPRCGNKDRPALDMHSGRTKRYILSESRWGRTNLTFRFLNYTPDINFPKIRKAIYDAFLVWSRVTHLTFTEIMFDSNNGKDADIRIQFAQRYHHDGYPFDGEGIILAHAFFPGEDRGGDTHFDDDEHWTFDSGEGVNLFMVAAHEFGHALGLSHSKTQGSLMYPWYQDQQSKGYKLPQDDVDGIQKLYGVKNGNETIDILVKEFDDNNPPDTDSDTPGVDEVPHGNCTHTFDAITKIRGDVYIFKGKYFWRWTSGALKDSKPIPISHFWYQFPESSIDAVFERKRDSKIMFFKGDKYWLYDANHMERGWPLEGRPLVELGLPGDLKKIDAAFTWSFNKRTYLVSNDMYWKFNEMESYMVYDYPRAMTIWQGVPTPLDAAFQFTDSKTYFIKGKHYWEYEDQKMRVKSREPTGNIAERWMQCPSAQKRVPYNNKKQMIYPTNGSSRMVEASGLLMWGLSYITRRLIV